MKKVRLTESDLIKIVKRVLKEDEMPTCTGNYDHPKGAIYASPEGKLFFYYIDEKGSPVRCQVPKNELKTSSIKTR
jgi:hypothetical protein